jgi:fumarate reductase flavoprotein subunit
VGVGVAPTAPIDPVTTEPSLVVYAGGIMLNKQGQRFVDESRVYLDICWAGLQQTDGFMLQVYDSRIRAAYLGSMMGVVMFGATEYRADTLAELFTQVSHADVGAASPSGSADIDVPASLASVATYNQYVADGHDPDFGRRHPLGNGGIGSEDGELRPIEAGPFYAAVTVAGTTHFNGGLAIDDQMRVIDVFARPIPGLFAAGEVVGGFHGAGYLSATFLGSAMIFGRVAGQNAARGL